MKRTLFRIFNVLMAVVVLISSTGFGLIEHSCQMRGKKISLVGSEQPGCVGCPSLHKAPVSTKPALKKKDCCQEEQRFENVDVTSSLSQLIAKFFKGVTKAIIEVATALVTTLVSWFFQTDASLVEHSPNAPPAFYGRTLLAFVQSFLI